MALFGTFFLVALRLSLAQAKLRHEVPHQPLALLLDEEDTGGAMALSLMQQGQRVGTTSTDWSLSTDRRENMSCSPLRNRGTHFTVEIEVGTPGQKFDVVADTGSDNVIVASCLCSDAGRCRAEDKCYRGTNRSSTFRMPSSFNGETPAIVLTFGSGQVEAVMATDLVRVGKVSTPMHDSVLLMVDQALSISGPFEGILGLGLPRSEEQDRELVPPAPPAHGRHQPHMLQGVRPKGFLESAGIGRFSMCFNDNADGVLRLGTPAEPGALGSIGTFHWGLDFRGISVGEETQPVAFCNSKEPGQDTPCGAIPDSGTTVIMADPDHLRSLFSQLCDSWPRCQEQARGSEYSKFELFQVLLLQCEDWMHNSTGLSELPPIHFHLAGAGGNTQTLKLDGNSYVFVTREDEVHYVTKHLFGIFPVRVAVATGRKRNVCLPAFASHSYNTQKNGPVWILGTPLFYEFQVGYDLESKPPSITFADQSCGSCASPALLASSARLAKDGGERAARRRPREVHGPIRTPSFDHGLPL